MRAFLFKLLIIFSSWLSLKSAHRLADWLAKRVWKNSSKQRHITLINLRLCYPEKTESEQNQMAQMALAQTMRSLLELGTLWRKNPNNIDALIRQIHGLEHFENALIQGRGMLLAAPHFGNWEVLNLWLSKQEKFSFLYKPPKDPAIERLLLKFRGQGQANQITANRQGVRKIFQAIKEQHIMAILPDQQPKNGQGLHVDFMGQPAYTMTLFSKIAAKTKAPAVMAVAQRLPNHQGFDLHFKPVPEDIYAEPNRSVECLNQSIAEMVTLDPSQYQWTYKRFSIRVDGSNPYKKGQEESST